MHCRHEEESRVNATIDGIDNAGQGSRWASRLAQAMRPTSSVVVWLGCVVCWALAAVLLKTVLPVTVVDQTQAGFFEPSGIIAIGVMGLLGAWLSTKTGFPDAWEPRISNTGASPSRC
jgi:hypothetical protein